jgi:pimeloyl-ACP methyl ester carboxylesterase
VPDIWAWRVFKIPVLGELLANFDVTKGSVRSFLDLTMYHHRLVTAQMVNEFWAPATYRVNRPGYGAAGAAAGLGADPGPARLDRHTHADLVGAGKTGSSPPGRRAALPGALPHASVHVLPGCGHLLELDCPGQADGYLASFLAPGQASRGW